MKAFKDLNIYNPDNESLKFIIQQIITNLPSNWTYRKDLVIEYSKNVSKNESEISCFESPQIKEVSGILWFVIWNNELKVVNIIPTQKSSLSHEEYNNILDAFNTECISKVDLKDSKITITKGEYDIEKIAGLKTYTALNQWVTHCNPSSGNTNHFDYERWADFVCIAFKEKTKLTPELLERWLIEEKNWDSEYEVLIDIVSDFENGLSLLKHYYENYES